MHLRQKPRYCQMWYKPTHSHTHTYSKCDLLHPPSFLPFHTQSRDSALTFHFKAQLNNNHKNQIHRFWRFCLFTGTFMEIIHNPTTYPNHPHQPRTGKPLFNLKLVSSKRFMQQKKWREKAVLRCMPDFKNLESTLSEELWECVHLHVNRKCCFQ